MNTRLFDIAFGISVGVHLALLLGSFGPLTWLRSPAARAPIEVVYEEAPTPPLLQQFQEQAERAARSVKPAPSHAGSHGAVRIQVPSRPILVDTETVSDLMPERPSTIDLTNLVDAARGDPVLLGYFSTIRQQIQRTANSRSWVSEPIDQGLVCVAFVLKRNGGIQQVGVVTERSSPSSQLQDVATGIVRSSAPFPPFPPSFGEGEKTIVVPLEFQSEEGAVD